MFLFIGGDPNTDWLIGSGVTLDPRAPAGSGTHGASRQLEASVRGLFPIADVRSRSTSASPPRSARERRSLPHCTDFRRTLAANRPRFWQR
jgi:hypothetical protein